MVPQEGMLRGEVGKLKGHQPQRHKPPSNQRRLNLYKQRVLNHCIPNTVRSKNRETLKQNVQKSEIIVQKPTLANNTFMVRSPCSGGTAGSRYVGATDVCWCLVGTIGCQKAAVI